MVCIQGKIGKCSHKGRNHEETLSVEVGIGRKAAKYSTISTTQPGLVTAKAIKQTGFVEAVIKSAPIPIKRNFQELRRFLFHRGSNKIEKKSWDRLDTNCTCASDNKLNRFQKFSLYCMKVNYKLCDHLCGFGFWFSLLFYL